MRPGLPTEAQVRAAMTKLLERAAHGIARATATALAAQLGISRPALYRRYRPLVDELLAAAEPAQMPARRSRGAGRDLEDELARTRRINEDLLRHVTLYEEVIRQLTVDNTRLRSQLEQHAGIVDLTARRHDAT